MAGVATSSRQRSRVAPYLMVLPALAYLAIFFVVPFFSLARTSLSSMEGSVFLPTLTFDWNFGNFADAISTYRTPAELAWARRWPMENIWKLRKA